MNRRQHLYFDAAGQLIWIAALILQSVQDSLLSGLFVFVLFCGLWQVANGLVSVYYYENPMRRTFLRVFGWAWLSVVSILGLLWVMTVAEATITMTTYSLGIWLGVIQIVWDMPLFFLFFVGWYMGITILDIKQATTDYV